MTAYFVMGSTDGVMSYSCTPIVRIFKPLWRTVVSYRTCPDRTIIGMESIHAHKTPVMAFVAPGPEVTQTAAIRLSTLA